VPPPPPNTPSMLSDPSMLGMGYGAYGMQVEYMSREALKDRVKELSIQVKDASAEFENRKRLKTEREARAKSFEQLYTEGVVSRRELENSQREATDSTDEMQRLEHKFNELSSLLERVNKRLAALPQAPSRKNQKAQQKLKKTQAKVIAPAKEQIKAADSKLIN
jgi:multidrug resistance efflux pump